MRKQLKQLTVWGLLAAAALPAGAYVITPDGGGQFDLTVSGSALTSWAVANGGSTVDTEGTWGTFLDGDSTVMSGSVNADQRASLIVPFSAGTQTFQTAILAISSNEFSYGSNNGQCMAYVTVGTVETLIYQHDSPDLSNPVYYNFDGAAPTGAGIFSTTVDISSLVAGANEFSLRLYSNRGWSGWAYNGGVFYDQRASNKDLVLTGSVVPEPASLALFGLCLAVLLRRRQG